MKNKDEKIYVLPLFVAILYLMIEPRLNFYKDNMITSFESFELIKTALQRFYHLIFISYQHISTLLLLIYLFFKRKANDKYLLKGLFLLVFISLIVIWQSYEKRYFDFDYRHLLVTVPFYLLLFIYPLRLIKNKTQTKIYNFWLFSLIIFTIARSLTIVPLFINKVSFQLKETIQESNSTQNYFVYIGDDEFGLSEFKLRAIYWYMESYNRNYSFFSSYKDLCEHPCQELEQCIIITKSHPNNCLDNDDSYIKKTNNFMNYYHYENSPLQKLK
ncbi:MAG: hypothetical protein OEX81_04890 [Candidatus Pacebacteria bacterium]|nr:hypothetical protein [Candidatus Paceibacterota bacterium]